MSAYDEGMIAIAVCLTILNVAVIGIFAYYVHRKTERSREEGIKIMVLVNNLIDIINDKYGTEEDEKQ